MTEAKMEEELKIIVHGCLGRMGRRLCCLAEQDERIRLVGVMECSDHPLLGRALSTVEPGCSESKLTIIASFDDLSEAADVVVDFSTPDATVRLLKDLEANPLPCRAIVVGTTGMTNCQRQSLESTSKRIPVLHAMNFSMGVNLIACVAAQIASALGEDFDIEIVEAHHNQKIDAPSGTALAIADKIIAATGRSRGDLVHGREGQVGKRAKGEIGMHALRLGGVVGDHTVHYGSKFERIEISHFARDRDLFVAGALRAAKWIGNSERDPGLYGMEDVLFERLKDKRDGQID